MQYIKLSATNLIECIIPEMDCRFPGVPIDKRFAPDFLAACVIVSDDAAVSVGMVYTGGQFTEPEPVPTPPDTLPEAKTAKIAESKKLLAEYLESHPLKSSCHGGKEAFYNITFEKQSQLANAFSAHVLFVQQGIADVMTWNDTGNICEVWTDAECIQLLKEIKDYVTPLVAKQQHLEIEIGACKTLQEVNAIEINYAEIA